MLESEGDVRRWLVEQGKDALAIEAQPVRHIVLVSVVERRGLEWSLRKAQPRSARKKRTPVVKPDPWSESLVHKDDEPPVGSRVSQALKGELHLGCEACDEEGRRRCYTCDGTGSVDHGFESRPRRCVQCSGKGSVHCDDCDGSGALWGTPTVWSVIEDVTAKQTVGGDDVPHEVYVELLAAEGRLLQASEGSELEGLDGIRGQGKGYRDSADESPEERASRALLAQPKLPEASRCLRQRLELREVPCWKVRTNTGEGWVYGEAPTWTLGEDGAAGYVGKRPVWLIGAGIGLLIALVAWILSY